MTLKQCRCSSPSTCGRFVSVFRGLVFTPMDNISITKFLLCKIFQLAALSSLIMPTKALLTYINSVNTSILRVSLQVLINTHLALEGFKRIEIWRSDTPSTTNLINQYDCSVTSSKLKWLLKVVNLYKV